MEKSRKIAHVIRKSIQKLVVEYRKNHSEKKEQRGTIRVGRASSLSSFFEKTFAQELSNIFPDLYFFVDYPISLYDENGKFQVALNYDILIVKNENKNNELEEGEILGIVDLKIDLGYLNDEYYKMDEKAEDKTKKTFNLRENNFKNAHKISCNKVVNANFEKKGTDVLKKIYLKNSENISKLAIVATRNNDHNRAGKYMEIMAKNGYECYFILDDKHHPNHNTEADFSSFIENGVENIDFIFNFDR